MVTGIPTAPCTNPYGDYLLSLSIQNKQDYARLHSYELHLMSQAVTSHIRAGPWQKIGFIQKVCTSGEMPSPRSTRMCDMRISGHTLQTIHVCIYCVPISMRKWKYIDELCRW